MYRLSSLLLNSKENLEEVEIRLALTIMLKPQILSTAQSTCFTCDRVSSKKQEDNTSLRAQKERGLKYAEEQGFRVVKNYSFVESASKRNRPNFHEMMRKALKLDIDIVIFKTVDRLARNLPDVQLVLDFNYEHGREIHLYDDGLRLTPRMDSNDALNFMLKGVLAKGETDRMGQRIRRAYEFKAEHGIKPGKAVVGYRFDRKELKHEIDPEFAPVLNFLFGTFDKNDYSCQEMAELMNAQGHPTGLYGVAWTAQNLHKILRNPTYHGEFYHKGKLIRANPEHHDSYYPKSRFIQRMEKLARHRQGRKHRKLQDPLTRFLKCADCGTTLTLDIKRKKSGREYHYYIHKCSSQNGKQVSIPRRKLFEIIDREIQKLRFSESFLTNLKTWFRNRIDEKDRTKESLLTPVEARITELNRKKNRLYDLWVEDGLPVDELKEVRDRYTAEILELRDQQKAIEGVRDNEVCDAICKTADEIKSLPIEYLEARAHARKAEKLRAQLHEIKLSSDRPLLKWKEPFSYIMRPAVLELALPMKKASQRSSKHSNRIQESERKNKTSARAGVRRADSSTGGAGDFEGPSIARNWPTPAIGESARQTFRPSAGSAASEFEDITLYGEGGIRTHGECYPTHAFQACTFNHSVTSPGLEPSRPNGREKAEFGAEGLCQGGIRRGRKQGGDAPPLSPRRPSPALLVFGPGVILVFSERTSARARPIRSGILRCGRLRGSG